MLEGTYVLVPPTHPRTFEANTLKQKFVSYRVAPIRVGRRRLSIPLALALAIAFAFTLIWRKATVVRDTSPVSDAPD